MVLSEDHTLEDNNDSHRRHGHDDTKAHSVDDDHDDSKRLFRLPGYRDGTTLWRFGPLQQQQL